ncbi:hypothetical protein KVS21_03380 [Helicobacter pylori]|nr:hypothetical protein KVS21_03380 [Helicobacter pylori]
MAYFESITAGRGGLDSFNQALNNQRYANLILNESMGNFANTIANAGSLFDNAKIKEEALKYQRMRDLANDKKQAEAFELQKRQAEQSMDFAKRQQILNEENHRQNKRLNEHRAKAMEQENRLNEQQFKWLMEANPIVKASALVGNEAKKTPTQTTQNTLNTLNTQGTPKPKTITKEEFKAIYANPMFRF